MKYLAQMSIVSFVIVTSEQCLANCPESLDGKIIRTLVTSVNPAMVSEKGIQYKLELDNRDDESTMKTRSYLYGTRLDELEGSFTKTERSNICTYNIHYKGKKDLSTSIKENGVEKVIEKESIPLEVAVLSKERAEPAPAPAKKNL